MLRSRNATANPSAGNHSHFATQSRRHRLRCSPRFRITVDHTQVHFVGTDAARFGSLLLSPLFSFKLAALRVLHPGHFASCRKARLGWVARLTDGFEPTRQAHVLGGSVGSKANDSHLQHTWPTSGMLFPGEAKALGCTPRAAKCVFSSKCLLR